MNAASSGIQESEAVSLHTDAIDGQRAAKIEPNVADDRKSEGGFSKSSEETLRSCRPPRRARASIGTAPIALHTVRRSTRPCRLSVQLSSQARSTFEVPLSTRRLHST